MSDSGRQIGQCEHAYEREYCVQCLRAEREKLYGLLGEFAVGWSQHSVAEDVLRNKVRKLLKDKGRATDMARRVKEGK